MNRHRFVALVLTLCGAMITIGGAIAQEASPAASTPVAERIACTAEPRDIDEMLALWFDPAGEAAATPVMTEAFADIGSLPAGAPADVATVEAITETTRGWIYCVEVAAQYARGFGYVTENLLAQFGPDTANPLQDSPDEVRAALEGQLAGTPIAGEAGAARMPPLVGPRRVRVLDDGRVGAIWSFGGDKVFFVYTLVGARWLIDDAIDVLETAATPLP